MYCRGGSGEQSTLALRTRPLASYQTIQQLSECRYQWSGRACRLSALRCEHGPEVVHFKVYGERACCCSNKLVSMYGHDVYLRAWERAENGVRMSVNRRPEGKSDTVTS